MNALEKYLDVIQTKLAKDIHMKLIEEQIAVMKAYAEGKKIESKLQNNESWKDDISPSWNWDLCVYRVKEEPKYRPFKNADECWNEMKKHEPFGWLNGKTSKFNIVAFDETECIIGKIPYRYANMFDKFTFADGTPFGIKEE